jgi:hypothetical protein
MALRLAGLLAAEPEQDEVAKELWFHPQRMTLEGQERFRRIARALANGWIFLAPAHEQ